MIPKNYSIVVRVGIKNHELLTQTFDEFPIVFGRGKDCHISFPQNSFLSKVHGMITFDQGCVRIEDADSRNGTFIRGQEINGVVRLERGEKFLAGGVEFQVTVTEIGESAQLATFVPINDPLVFKGIKLAEKRKSPLADSHLGRPTIHASTASPSVSLSELKQAPQALPTKRAEKKSTQTSDAILDPNFSDPINLPPKVVAQIFDSLGDYTVVSDRLIKISRDLRLEDEIDLRRVESFNLTLQGVVTWGTDIFDVRQFKDKDVITVGGNPADAVYIPFINKKMQFGLVHQNKGYLVIPKSIRWRLDREGHSFSPVESINKKIALDMGKHIQVPLILNDLCTLDMGEDVTLHFRYVKVPRPLIGRSWIENREEIKKAVSLSLAIHFIVAFIAMFLAPKTIAPTIENVPERFAKLLIEPPKMILAPPPPELPIPAPIAEKPLEPIPKPVVEKKIESPKVVAKKKPVEKLKKTVEFEKVKPVVAQKVMPPVKFQPTSQQVPKVPPVPSLEDSFAKAFAAAAPAANANKIASTHIKINKDPDRSGTAGGGVGKGLSGALKSKVGKMNQGSGGGFGGGLGNSVGAGVGQISYANAGGSSQVGKRRIASAVIGTPKLKESDIPQGLSQNEVMNEVNKHLADLRRCYERALFQDTNISGRVEYEWNISPKGVVTNAQVTRSGVSNGDFLNNCVIGVIKKLKFPNSKNGQPTVANIGFPFGKN